MKNKFIITGMGNDGFLHKYIIKKNNNFIKTLTDFLADLGFENSDYDIFEDAKGRLLKATSIRDSIDHFKNNKFDIDLFFGDKKVILLVRTTNRNLLLKTLDKYSIFIEQKIKKPKRKK